MNQNNTIWKSENQESCLPAFRFSKYLLLFLLCAGLNATAQTNTNTASVLTATVYPGYVFGPTEPPNASKLNRLGLPTVRITGSIDGSSLSAGGVGNDTLATNTFDQLTIIGGYGSGRSNVTVNFDTNTLTSAAGHLAVNYDTNSLTLSNNAMAVNLPWVTSNSVLNAAGYLVGTGTNGTNVAITVGTSLQLLAGTLDVNQTNFVSAEYAIASGAIANTNHNLGVKPGFVRWVLVCKTASAGYAIGDELPVEQANYTGGGGQLFTTGANSTNVFAVGDSLTVDMSFFHKTTGVFTDAAESSWRLKCYARP